MRVVELTTEQRNAVERLGQDVCVVAGPGSGKTRVLVERFEWLVESRKVSPLGILAITFTEKAALEIKDRLAKRFAGREIQAEVHRAPVSTIHAFCSRLLRENAVRAGLDPEYEVLDERQAALEMTEAMEEVLDRFARERRDDFRFLGEHWASNDVAAALLGVYGALRANQWGGTLSMPPAEDPLALLALMKDAARAALAAEPGKSDASQKRAAALREFIDAGEDPDDPVEWAYSLDVSLKGANDAVKEAVRQARDVQPRVLAACCAPARESVAAILREFDAAYGRRKRERSALDYDGLEEEAIRLLEANPALRDEVRAQFKFILMDELQDTSPVQWRLLNLIRAEDRFFAVGDINQSIYGFRHADPAQFAAYESRVRAAGKAVDLLQDNYRSRQEILDVAMAVANGSPGIVEHRLNGKKPFPKAERPCVEAMRVEEDALEPRWIAWRIRQLVDNGYAEFKDIAVLSRKTTSFADLEAAFEEFHIPCVVAKRGRNFFGEPEIVDLTNWLRVLAGTKDEIAEFALLRSPYYALADEELLRRRCEGAALVPAAIEAEWASLRAVRDETPPDLLLGRVIDARDIESALSPRQRANVDKFMEMLRDWHARLPGRMEEWIEEIDDLRQDGKEPNAPAPGSQEAVQLLTIFGAKGLQFRVVFLPGLHQGARDERDPICWSPETGLGMSWRDPFSGKATPDAPTVDFRARAKSLAEEEGHRLLYVGMTRAKELLALSWCAEKGRSAWPARIEEALKLNWDGVPPVQAVKNEQGLRLYRATEPATMAFPAPAAFSAPPPRVLPPLEKPGGPAAAYSVTDVADFAACPRRYWLARAARWPLADPAGPGGAALGTQVHEILAGVTSEEHTQDALALAARFHDSELGRRAARAASVQREYPFTFAFEGTVFTGIVDLWFDEGAERVLVDYKTGSGIGRMPGYELQLRLYALGIPGKATRAFLSFLSRNEAVEVDLKVGCETVLRDFLAAQSSYDFPLREGEQCSSCAFLGGACPSLGWPQ